MKSCLYSCEVYHDRKRPKTHRFSYNVFTFCIDLDDIERVLKNPLISESRWMGIYSLCAEDHLQFGCNSIKDNLTSYLRTQGFNQELGRVQLITNLRTFGHQFNPVSFYFVRDIEDQPLAVVAEVANTFNEQKLYVLDATKHHNGRVVDEQPKEFYISPFSDLDTTLHFNVKFPDNHLDIHINESDEKGIYFRSSMLGQQKALTTPQLMLQTLKFPAATLLIVFSIHWHALKLYLKKVPVRKKSDHPELQTNTRTYLSKNRPKKKFQVV